MPTVCPLSEDCRQKIEKTHVNTARILERLDALKAISDEHHRTLYGNGKPGLEDDVASWRMARTALWLVMGAVATLLVSAGGYGVFWIIGEMHRK